MWAYYTTLREREQSCKMVCMAIFDLQLLNVPRQQFLVRLDAVDCLIEVWYQAWDDSWQCSVEAPSGTALVTGRRVVLGSPIINLVDSPLVGEIHCRGTRDDVGDPGRYPWGETHRLTYETPD